MSGGVGGGAAAAGGGVSVSVTIVDAGGTFGFVGGSFGAVSPSTFNGKAMSRITGGNAGVDDLRIEFPLTVTQNFFRAVLVQRTANTWVRYESAAASFSGGVISAGIWQWGAGANLVWTAAGTRPIIFIR